MFSNNDEAYLLRAISQNSCVLFLGAGFSLGITNRLGQDMPLGGTLAKELWTYLGYKDPYQEKFGLQKVFQLAIKSGKSKEELQSFLEDRYITANVPEKYNAVDFRAIMTRSFQKC